LADKTEDNGAMKSTSLDIEACNIDAPQPSQINSEENKLLTICDGKQASDADGIQEARLPNR
jgi:hypothetical protein